jgi:hypothetical protein
MSYAIMDGPCRRTIRDQMTSGIPILVNKETFLMENSVLVVD